jgi:hypothetical protein
LNRCGYTGLEPNAWLIDEGIKEHLGRDVVDVKAPTFISNESFDLSGLEPFDFILAQSIASHTGPDMTRSLLASVSAGLKSSGLAAITFIHGRNDRTEDGWEYPGIVRYRRQTIARWVSAAGLSGGPIPWYHPRQTWWVLARGADAQPPRLLKRQLRGATASYRGSWDAPYHFRREVLPKRLPDSVVRWVTQRRAAARHSR